MSNVSSSNSQGVHVPKLRFPGFEGVWQNSELKKICVYQNIRREIPKSLFISTENMNQNCAGIIPYTEDCLVQGICFEVGDVLFANIRPYLKKAWSATFSGGCSSDVLAFHPIAVRTDFFRFLLSRDCFFTYVMSGVKGSKMPRGDKKHIMEYNVSRPLYEEQEKIASFMLLIETRIEKQRQLVDALKSYKRGVLERVFDWIVNNYSMSCCLKLGELFTKNTKRNTKGLITNVITNSAEKGLLPQRDYFDKNIAVDGNTMNYYVIENGDFVYNPRKSINAPYGPFNIYQGKEAGIVSPLYLCLKQNGAANGQYLYWYFQSTTWHRYMYDKGSQGARHDRVSMTDDLLMQIPVYLPNDRIQYIISDLLDNFHKKFSLQEEILNSLLTMKQGLMKSLFI